MANQRVLQAYEDKEKRFGEPMLRQLEKIIMLQTIDSLWKDHLLNMDHLKEGIGLRGYGQKNPLQEYQKEGFDMFEEMVRRNRRRCRAETIHGRAGTGNRRAGNRD